MSKTWYSEYIYLKYINSKIPPKMYILGNSSNIGFA